MTLAEIVVVTGLSGAGKSTALAALEDLGFHTLENLPPNVVEAAIEACEKAGIEYVALGFGGGVGGFLVGAAEALRDLAQRGRRLHVLFLDASEEIVLRRFSETRRPHPFSNESRRHGDEPCQNTSSVSELVTLERERLASLRALATVVIDTSNMRVHDLRRQVVSIVRPLRGPELRLTCRVTSFGFKYGVPTDADLVFDVRFLDNPYFVPELRALTGLDLSVREFVLQASGAAEFISRVVDLCAFLLPRYEAEGKSYLTIAFGCTGGQHRSVTCAITVAEAIRQFCSGTLIVSHRDVNTSGPRGTLIPPGGGT